MRSKASRHWSEIRARKGVAGSRMPTAPRRPVARLTLVEVAADQVLLSGAAAQLQGIGDRGTLDGSQIHPSRLGAPTGVGQGVPERRRSRCAQRGRRAGVPVPARKASLRGQRQVIQRRAPPPGRRSPPPSRLGPRRGRACQASPDQPSPKPPMPRRVERGARAGSRETAASPPSPERGRGRSQSPRPAIPRHPERTAPTVTAPEPVGPSLTPSRQRKASDWQGATGDGNHLEEPSGVVGQAKDRAQRTSSRSTTPEAAPDRIPSPPWM